MSATSPVTIARGSLRWSTALSILMILAGILGIVVPSAAGIAATMIVGWLLIFSGGAHLVFGWHTRSAGGFIWELLVAVFYLATGGYLLTHPAGGLLALTLVLAFFLLMEGIMEFVLSFRLRPMHGSGWLLLDGILTVIVAVLIWRTWPFSAAWAVGMLVGISMLFSGLSRLVLSLGARRAISRMA